MVDEGYVEIGKEGEGLYGLAAEIISKAPQPLFNMQLVEYPRWEKRYIGRVTEDIYCECGETILDTKIIDKGIDIDTYILAPILCWDVIPKVGWKKKKKPFEFIDIDIFMKEKDNGK